MTAICSFDSVENSIKEVVVPLIDGLHSINRVYKALIEEPVDPVNGQSSNYTYIRDQIVEATQSLERSEQEASTRLKSLDQYIEILTRDEGQLEQDMSATKRTLDNLKNEQTSNEKLLKDSEGALESARSNLNSTRETLQSQEERKRTAEIVTDVGTGLLIIPVVGWIAGSAMIIGGAIEMSQASETVRAAEEEVRNFESQEENYKSKVSEYKSKIYNIKCDIKKQNDMVKEIRKKIQKVKLQKEALDKFQVNVRRAVHMLTVLSGHANVAECQTRRLILQEPMIKVMEDVMRSAAQITENQLRSIEDTTKLLSDMKENHQKLEANCDSSSDDENCCYCCCHWFCPHRH